MLQTVPLTVMRLDVYLAESGLASSRSEAKALIEEGAVSVASRTVTKPAFDVTGQESTVSVDKSEHRYVGRGGMKLEAAIADFGIVCEGRRCLDVGASSGGFTDCLLKNGADHVIALDSGHGQLVSSLREDGRVTVIEDYNARYLKLSDLEYAASLAVMDVSFISATYIIPALSECLCRGADFICLIKPQFEVGRAGVGKGGIVKDEKVRLSAVSRVVECAESVGFTLLGRITSPIRGGDGNVEYLAHFRLTSDEDSVV